LNVALSEEYCAVLCKVIYSVAERVAIVEAYINTGSVKETCDIFGSKFPGKGLLAKRVVQALLKKWHTAGSVANAPK
jgi:hypothetical protein